jgi:hypothetical protein
MKWNREEVSRLLNTRITEQSLEDGKTIAVIHFEDSRMRYEMLINNDGVYLAADPEMPIQGLPFFEISLPCTELAPVPRSGMPTGIGTYSGSVKSGTLRFSITRRNDGSISLSGAWEGLTAPHGEATTIPSGSAA